MLIEGVYMAQDAQAPPPTPWSPPPVAWDGGMVLLVPPPVACGGGMVLLVPPLWPVVVVCWYVGMYVCMYCNVFNVCNVM